MKAKRLINKMLESSNNTFDEQVLREYEESKQVCPVCDATMEGNKCSVCTYNENAVFSCPYLNESSDKRTCNIDESQCDKYGLDYEGCSNYHSHWD